MEPFRDNLIQKIDDIISDITKRDGFHPQVQLQIEATILGDTVPQLENRRKYILGTVDLGQWKPSTPIRQEATHQQVPTPDLDNSTPASPLPNLSQSPPTSAEQCIQGGRPRRKVVGGLRLGGVGITPPRTPSPPGTRQLAPDQRSFPKRRRLDTDGPTKLQPSTVDKLIEGIWEQVHKSNQLVYGDDLIEFAKSLKLQNLPSTSDFAEVSRRCSKLTGVSRTARSIEVIMQAFWVECYEARIESLKTQRPDLRLHEHKKLVMNEACTSFNWSEKDLRNRMGIWKGYREIKDAAGWAALVFAGPGIYRFCKYRLGFDQEGLSKLQSIRTRLEVAADTLQPHWRQIMALVGLSSRLVYHGHPHDWVVGKRKDPVPLAWTYRHISSKFSFEHISESVIDESKWGSYDPRRVDNGPHYICVLCTKAQSAITEKNECQCFNDLFGSNSRTSCPVQIFSTEDGRNNGLIACCTFDRGAPVGEFVGLVTKNLENVDVMQSCGLPGVQYQISQARMGNFTRFINHSCQPNCQFQTFTWLGIQRTLVVSKGVPAGKELTVDYSSQYWRKLDKVCLCGEARCRYKQNSKDQAVGR